MRKLSKKILHNKELKISFSWLSQKTRILDHMLLHSFLMNMAIALRSHFAIRLVSMTFEIRVSACLCTHIQLNICTIELSSFRKEYLRPNRTVSNNVLLLKPLRLLENFSSSVLKGTLYRLRHSNNAPSRKKAHEIYKIHILASWFEPLNSNSIRITFK